MRIRGERRKIVVGLLAVSLVAGTAACGTERSTEAYCDLFNERVAGLREVYPVTEESELIEVDVDAGIAPPEDLERTTELLGEFADLYEDLQGVAPPKMELSVRLVAENWRQQANAIAKAGDDPASAGMDVGALGAQNSGPKEKVANFEAANCL